MNARMRWVARILAVALVAVVGLSATVQPAEAKSKYKVSVAISAAAYVTGDSLSLKGKVAGKTKKRYVYLQSRVPGGSFHTVKKIRTSKHGYWSAVVPADSAGVREFRLYKPSERYHKKGYSKTISVTVDPLVTSVVTPIPHDTITTEDLTMSACSAPVMKVPGSDGSRTDKYEDGVLVSTDIVDPVTEEVTVGSSPAPCTTGMDRVTGSADGGTKVTVTGKNLSGTVGVTVGEVAAELESAAATEVVFTTAAGPAGAAAVQLDNGIDKVAAGTFTYLPPPTISSLSSASGSMTGGETISIFGANLADVTKVTFTPTVKPEWTTSGDGSMPAVPAVKTTVVSDSQVDVVVPPGLGGAETLTVVSPNGKASSAYTYVRIARDASEVESAFVNRVNELRAQGYDCGGAETPAAPALAWDGELADFSMSHSVDVLQRNDLYPAYTDLHLYPGLSQWSYRLPLAGLGSTGEVLQRSIATSSTKLEPRQLTAQDGTDAADIFMMQSVGHCKILMNPYAHYVGAGITAMSITDNSFGLVTTANVRA